MRLFCVVIGMCTLLHAADETTVNESVATKEPLTANQAARMAQAVAPEVAVARIEQLISAADVRAELAFSYPKISAHASYTKASLDYQDVPVFGNVAFNRENEYRTGVEVTQFIYGYNRFSSAYEADRQLRLLAQHKVSLSQRDMAYAARRSFENVRLARARLLITDIRFKQRTGERNDARALVEAGRANNTDANLAEIVLSQSQDELTDAKSDLENSLIQLAALIGVERQAMPLIKEEPIERPNFESLLSEAGKMINGSGEIVSMQIQGHYEDAMSRLEMSHAYPELNVRGFYGADGSQPNNLDDNWSASVALTWKIYDGGNTLARQEAAAQRSRQLRMQQRAVLRDRQVQLDQARTISRSLIERIELAEKVVDLAKANYEDARSQYRAGRLTLTQVGDSSLRMTEAYYRLLALRYNEAILAHDLERLAE